MEREHNTTQLAIAPASRQLRALCGSKDDTLSFVVLSQEELTSVIAGSLNVGRSVELLLPHFFGSARITTATKVLETFLFSVPCFTLAKVNRIVLIACQKEVPHTWVIKIQLDNQVGLPRDRMSLGTELVDAKGHVLSWASPSSLLAAKLKEVGRPNFLCLADHTSRPLSSSPITRRPPCCTATSSSKIPRNQSRAFCSLSSLAMKW